MQQIKDPTIGGRDEVKNITRSQNLKSFAFHKKEFGYKHNGNGKPLKSCEQRRHGLVCFKQNILAADWGIDYRE